MPPDPRIPAPLSHGVDPAPLCHGLDPAAGSKPCREPHAPDPAPAPAPAPHKSAPTTPAHPPRPGPGGAAECPPAADEWSESPSGTRGTSAPIQPAPVGAEERSVSPRAPAPSTSPDKPVPIPDPDFLCALVKTGFNLEAAVAQLNLSGTELLEFARAPDLRDYLNDIQGLYSATLELQKLSALSAALSTLKDRAGETNDDQVERRRAAAAITTFSRPTRATNSTDDDNGSNDDPNDNDPDNDNDSQDSQDSQDPQDSGSPSPSASSATSAFSPSGSSKYSSRSKPPTPPKTFREGCERRVAADRKGPATPQRKPDDLDKLPFPTLDLTHEQVIAKCLGALQHNDDPFPDAGIKTIFNFASQDNHLDLGFPHYDDFASVFKHGMQSHLVNHDSYVIPPQLCHVGYFGPRCRIMFFHVHVTKAGVQVTFEVGVCSIDHEPGPLHLAVLGPTQSTRPLHPP